MFVIIILTLYPGMYAVYHLHVLYATVCMLSAYLFTQCTVTTNALLFAHNFFWGRAGVAAA